MPKLDSWLSACLVYLLLGGYLTTTYTAILWLGGVRDDGQVPWWLNVISITALVLTVRPVHAWLVPGVHRVIYGQHDDPYSFITEIQERAGADPTPQSMLPAIAEAIAASLRLPYVGIDTMHGETALAAEHGLPVEGAELVTIALEYHGVPVGNLQASARRRGELLSVADVRLLNDLARQVSITLRAAQLSAAAQASRLHVVTAREEERRRIRRDLHDGLGPTLAFLRLQLGAIRRLVESEPERAIEMIDALRADVATATGDIRRLVYELRPPMLDEFGLEGAIANLCASGDVPRFFEIAEPLPKLSAATEVALFRIVSEALHNVDRHSKAKECRIRLDAGADDVTLVVADDGVGMDRPGPKGVGMISMRERAEELGGSVAWSSGPGGGCVVRATVPI